MKLCSKHPTLAPEAAGDCSRMLIWVRGDALHRHPALPALMGPLVIITFMATYGKVTPLRRGGPGSAWGSSLPFSELYGLLLIGKFQACKAFVSNIWDEYESKWSSDELVFPGFSRGLGSWRGLVSDRSAPSTYTCWALEIFRVWLNEDMPCMGSTWNTEKVLAHFLQQ